MNDRGAMDPQKVVASFDSASVLHAATVAALKHERFPHLGSSSLAALGARVGGRLPWPILKQIYSRIGGAEGIAPERLGEVDLAAVASSFADAYERREYPAVVVGSSNGAMSHAAAALQTPWLPGTVLVPVHRVGDPQRPDLALEFGRSVAPALLEANPNVVLHQMHDSAQDELMAARMTYFRPKWTALPAAYERFLSEALAPGAPVIVVDDESEWPVVRVDERHVFQSGGRGGLTPEQYLRLPNTPTPDATAPEAEWGSEPRFTAAVIAWAKSHDHPVVRIRIDGPQEAAHPIAVVMRDWIRMRGGSADTLIVPSFVLGDPWRTVELARVPFWTFFPVRSAIDSLEFHLSQTERYSSIDILLFQHGADSPNIATPGDFTSLARRHGAEPRMLALRPDKSPHDIGSLGRYGPAMNRENAADIPFEPLDVPTAIDALRAVTGERGRSIVEEE